MNRPTIVIAFLALTILSLGALPGTARADTFLDSYVARLSYADHHNSSGKPITTVAGIIRQDRANYHKFHRRDPADRYDSVFADVHNRDIMEAKLQRGHCSPSARRKILYGTPLIFVKIYRSHIDVTILD